MKARLRSFPISPSDWNYETEILMLSLEEEGAYIRALCLYWDRGYIPSDPAILAKWIGKLCPEETARIVSGMFIPHETDPSKLVHKMKAPDICMADSLQNKRVVGSAWKALRESVFKRDGFTCVYCGASGETAELHCDHIHPVSLGGGNEIENLVTACQRCNVSKNKKSILDWSPDYIAKFHNVTAENYRTAEKYIHA